MGATTAISLCIGIIGCVVGVVGYFAGHEKNTKEETEKAAEWRGSVNGKLDSILGLTNRVDDLEDTVQEHEIKISKLQDSTRRAHERMDHHMDNHNYPPREHDTYKEAN